MSDPQEKDVDRIEARARFEGQVLARLTSIDSKIDSINATAATAAATAAQATATATAAAATTNDHEVRMRSLEEDRGRAKGMSAAISAGMGFVVTAIGWLIQTRFK